MQLRPCILALFRDRRDELAVLLLQCLVRLAESFGGLVVIFARALDEINVALDCSYFFVYRIVGNLKQFFLIVDLLDQHVFQLYRVSSTFDPSYSLHHSFLCFLDVLSQFGSFSF